MRSVKEIRQLVEMARDLGVSHLRVDGEAVEFDLGHPVIREPAGKAPDTDDPMGSGLVCTCGCDYVTEHAGGVCLNPSCQGRCGGIAQPVPEITP